jgi:hypothetical protein
MAKQSRSAADRRLDELYREHPGEFVSGRDELAKELRAAGDREQADAVKELRRPTAAAWLLNRAALDSPGHLKEFAAASRQLEQAQARALEGKDEGAAEWRAAAARERDAVLAILEVAEGLARDAGHPAGASALERAEETLRAASADPELRERVLQGRVEREQSAATLGTPAAAPAPARGPAAAKRREAAKARRELGRLEEGVAEATAREERLRARIEEATEALRSEKEKLAESKRETAAVKRKLKAAQRRAGG